MSRADLEFIATCKHIINNGTVDDGVVRTRWQDGTPAHTIAAFGVVNRFNLAEEFPALTLRRTPVKTATDELLWIWQKKSNRIEDLHAKIWDQWADDKGTIGKAYGYQLGQKAAYADVNEDGLKNAFPGYRFVGSTDSPLGYVEFLDPETQRVAAIKNGAYNGLWQMDQVNKVIYDLKNNPFSRRIMTSLWNVADLHAMNLQPCVWNCNFMVTKKPGADRLTLNMVLNQRSQDVLAAWAWNTAQYAVLVHMLAQVCDMEPGELVHMDVNCHIYDRHVEIVKQLIERTPQPAPDFWLNPDVKDFYRFTPDDVRLDNYRDNYRLAGEQIKDIPVAI